MKLQLLGDKKLMRRLDAIAPKLRKKILRSAVTAAARPLRNAAKSAAPKRYGYLKKSMDIRVGTSKAGIYAVVGPRSDMIAQRPNLWGKVVSIRPAWYAHLVEQGVKPHAIRRKNGATWNHPGVTGRHYFKTAITGAQAQARAIMASKIKEGLRGV